MKNFTSILALGAILPALWFHAWPVGETACANPSYKFRTAEATLSHLNAGALAKKGACMTVNSWPL